jgi:hypothetical protein
MKSNIMRALVAAVAAIAATILLAPPEAITQIMFCVLAFGLLFGALFLFRKKKPEENQA